MTVRAILLKLQPNQDVTLALEEAVHAAGLGRARIVAAVGSITQGVLDRGNGQNEVVAGPAIEVAALRGEVDPQGGSVLHGHLCCADARVVAGTLVRGLNAVAVTFEILLEACEAA